MISLHDMMAVIGYCVSFAGAVTLVFFLIGLCWDYCLNKIFDLDAIIRVFHIAKKNNIKIVRRRADS